MGPSPAPGISSGSARLCSRVAPARGARGTGGARLRQHAWGTARQGKGTSRMSRHVATGCGATWRDRARHAAGRAPGGAGAGAGPAALRGQRAMPGWPVATVTGGSATPEGCEADELRCRRPPSWDGAFGGRRLRPRVTGTELIPPARDRPGTHASPVQPGRTPLTATRCAPRSFNPPGSVLPPHRAAAPLPARRHREGPGGTGRDGVGLPVLSAVARKAQSRDTSPVKRHSPAEIPVRPRTPVPVPVTVPLGPPPTPWPVLVPVPAPVPGPVSGACPSARSHSRSPLPLPSPFSVPCAASSFPVPCSPSSLPFPLSIPGSRSLSRCPPFSPVGPSPRVPHVLPRRQQRQPVPLQSRPRHPEPGADPDSGADPDPGAAAAALCPPLPPPPPPRHFPPPTGCTGRGGGGSRREAPARDGRRWERWDVDSGPGSRTGTGSRTGIRILYWDEGPCTEMRVLCHIPTPGHRCGFQDPTLECVWRSQGPAPGHECHTRMWGRSQGPTLGPAPGSSTGMWLRCQDPTAG